MKRAFHPSVVMSRNDPDILIHPRRGRKERALPEKALFVVNPAEARLAQESFKKYLPQKRQLYNSELLVDRESRLCLAGPALGAPAAGLIMEKLIALGVRDILLISCCGVVDPAFSIGDVLVGGSGIVGEGVSGYYGVSGSVSPCRKMTAALEGFLDQKNIAWKQGALWSTDAPYRERRSELVLLQEQHGVSAVDMEFTALCSIAAFRGVGFAGLFIVSDELWGKAWRPGFTSKDFRNRSRLLLNETISHALHGEQE